MVSGKISGDPLALTTAGLNMAALQAGANVQAPSSLFASAANNLSDLGNTATALTNLGGLSSALAASTYLTQVDAASTYLTIAAAGSGYQPLDADLTSWAGVTRAAGFDTFTVTPSSANFASLLTDKTGTGVNVFATSPTLTTPTITTRIEPTADDGAPLGSTTKRWSDLFLASGGVINWNNGDVLITHVANQLQMTGAAAGYVYDAVIAPTPNDGAPLGTSSFSWSDLFLASGAVVNFANSDYTITHSSGALTFSGGATFTSATAFAPQLINYNTTNDVNAAYSILQKGRAGAAVQVGDTLGTYLFQGLDSTGTPVMQSAAYLTAVVESVGVGSVLARFNVTAGTMVWQFKTDGSFGFPTMTLGTAGAGRMEFDGKAWYANSVASSRQVVAAKQIATVQGSAVALTNNIATAQSIFAAANDTLTVAATTTYRFRARLTFNTGATSHTTAFGFGGTATFTTCNYTSQATSSAAATLATPQMLRAAVATATVLTAASTAVTTDIILEGIVRINGAGTIIPQVTFSAGPTGTCETAIDSYFELEPIGSNTVAAIGNWA